MITTNTPISVWQEVPRSKKKKKSFMVNDHNESSSLVSLDSTQREMKDARPVI